MVFNEHPIEVDDLGVPLFQETSICVNHIPTSCRVTTPSLLGFTMFHLVHQEVGEEKSQQEAKHSATQVALGQSNMARKSAIYGRFFC